MTNLTNPKSVTFVVALLPQFVDRGIGRWLSRQRRARQAPDAGSGAIMVALAGRLALER